MSRRIKFMLDGCDIQFYAEAPADITLEQLLRQCDRIEPDWCCCGICSAAFDDDRLELRFDYDDVEKVDADAPCKIWEKGAHKYE